MSRSSDCRRSKTPIGFGRAASAGRAYSVAAALALLALRGGAFAQDSSTAQWLVDRGRTLGLMTPKPTARDAERVLVWVQAAGRTSPGLAEAFLWQYDLLGRMGRAQEALAALAKYSALNPTDLAARLDLIEGRFAQAESVEKRLAFCEHRLVQLGTEGLRDPGSEGDHESRSETAPTPTAASLTRSDLHRRMADLYLRSGDAVKAEEHANLAVQAFAGNVAALTLLVELSDDRERPVRQIRAHLAALAATPADADKMWRLARTLDELAMSNEALAWYGRAKRALERSGADAVLLNDFLVDYARACTDAGRYEQAFETAERLVATAPDLLPARFVLLDVATRLAKTEVIETQKAYLRAQFKDGVSGSQPAGGPTSRPGAPGTTAPMAAWYYTLFDPDPEKAVRFALRAKDAGERGGDVIYGLAKLLAGEVSESVQVLGQRAPTDPWAAAGLGEALLKEGQREKALQVLRAGEVLRYSGLAYERIAALLARENEALSPLPDRAAAVEALRAFDERVLAFAEKPAAALRFSVSPSQPQWIFADPWQCELKLTNTAPYPISIGEARMAAGRVLVSLVWEEGPGRRWAGYLPLALHDQPVLAPGASVARNVTLDVGPAAALARSFPQRELNLIFTFMLDPAQSSGGEWRSALRDFPSDPLKVTRQAVDASRGGLERLAAMARRGSEIERMRAVRTLAALARESQSTLGESLGYTPRRVDEAELTRAVMEALKDPAPTVRATALDALRGLTFTRRTLQEVAPLLSDESWLVRLLAIDVLAEMQGEKFRTVLERLSSADGDELVRRAANLALESLPPPRPK